MLSFFTIIFAAFLYDLAYAYQITSKRVHLRQSYDVIAFVQDGSHRVGNVPPPRVVLLTALV